MNRELFREAVAVVDGVPEHRLNMNLFLRYLSHRTPQDCGTVACAAGWMCLYPKFQEMGLSLNENGLPTFKVDIGYLAMAKFFQISQVESQDLFCPRGSSIYDRRINKKMTDKEVFWNRTVQFLEEKKV